MEHCVHTIPDLPDNFRIHICRLQLVIELLVFLFEHPHFGCKLFTVFVGDVVCFQIPNCFVVFGEFVPVCLCILFSYTFESTLGFIGNRLQACAGVDITDAGFQTLDALFV